MNIILIILIFGIIIAFHEFGHFLVAKLNHIAVTEFSIGMGPAIFSTQKKETKYSLRLLPIGGYCMMLGENEESEDERAFSNKPVWVRMMVVLAGPVFNIILAFVFSIVLIHLYGFDKPTLTYIQKDSAAYEAGIEEGDTIIKLNEDNIYNFRELQLYMVLNDNADPIKLTVQKANGDIKNVTVVPKLNANGEYKIGVASGYEKPDGISENISYSAYEVRYWLKATFTSLKLIVTGGVKSGDIMGPVGVGGAINDVIEEVKEESETKSEAALYIFLNLLNWSILLSVNLGIMNLLPIPALDGGRLLLLIVEAVRRKKIPEEKEAIVNLVGVVILVMLMVVVLFNDIKNVFF
ncbi:MAG: site-2 protease family protein [Lachnospiraceae bacterium]|nr:site-2 protease family protein [Lachnospiraceae bacterium]